MGAASRKLLQVQPNVRYEAPASDDVLECADREVGGWSTPELLRIRAGRLLRRDPHATEAARKADFGDPEILSTLFKHSETSQAKGREYLARSLGRTEDRDVPCSVRTRDAQYDAIVAWGAPDHGKLLRLTAIEQPTQADSEDNDLMIPPRLTHLLGALIPDAQVKIYPDSGHGFLFQHHAQFAADVNGFLEA
jgi:pimeloyl-ACP methyl ester carboxylesterase